MLKKIKLAKHDKKSLHPTTKLISLLHVQIIIMIYNYYYKKKINIKQSQYHIFVFFFLKQHTPFNMQLGVLLSQSIDLFTK